MNAVALEECPQGAVLQFTKIQRLSNLIQNARINAFSVIADSKPQLLFVVPDLHFNVAGP